MIPASVAVAIELHDYAAELEQAGIELERVNFERLSGVPFRSYYSDIDWLVKAAVWDAIEGYVGDGHLEEVARYGEKPCACRESAYILRALFGDAGSVWCSLEHWFIVNAEGTRMGVAHLRGVEVRK